MSGAFPLLASPGRIGPMELANRIVLLPHGLFFAERGALRPTEAHLRYYQARAAGGVGLVCVESSVVSLDGQQGAPLVLSSDPGCVDGYARIAAAVHSHGARISGQLTHYGNQAAQLVTQAPLIGPSRLPDAAMREPARPMDGADMERVRGDFAAGAANFAAAGFDAVEIKVAHDGLLRQFLSPLCNDRRDDYGGSVQNRMRYPLQIAAAVREAIGPAVALSVRLVLDECLPGGYGLEEGLAFAAAFADSGLVDGICADVGIWASVDRVVAPMPTPEGYAQDAFSAAAEQVGVPIVAFGRIRTPEYAERLLEEGHAYAVGMARELIADPDFAAKALRGERERIRPCTGCNQLCVGNSMKLLPVSCTVNPWVGAGERAPAATTGGRQRVVVVGAGPAGMEAACAAARAGHETILLEREQAVGGRLALAAACGRRDGWGEYVAWAAAEVRRHGVELRIGRRASTDSILALAPDLVVLACGARPAPAPAALDGALSLEEFLLSRRDAESVALLDLGAAGPPLWSAALEAHLRGIETVTVVTPGPLVGADLDGPTFLSLYRQLVVAGVRMITDHVAVSACDGGVEILNVYSGASATVAAETIVVSTTPIPEGAEIEAQLAGVPTVRIGDALAPRDASAAIREGQALAAGISTAQRDRGAPRLPA
jgi:2,4-dienoyl-CoA reductase-like NADH-dependent reductase (Old Yellow Enzyme family)